MSFDDLAASAQDPKNFPVEFEFDATLVRTIAREGPAWFVVKDVCDILDIGDPSKAVGRHLRQVQVFNQPLRGRAPGCQKRIARAVGQCVERQFGLTRRISQSVDRRDHPTGGTNGARKRIHRVHGIGGTANQRAKAPAAASRSRNLFGRRLQLGKRVFCLVDDRKTAIRLHGEGKYYF